jgi:hypothetical protein
MDKKLADALRAHPGITVTDLSRLNCCRPGLLPAFLQDGRDVHGSHGLFYWLRARQRGMVISQEHAGVVLTWRPDVGRLVALRPIGDASAAADLLDTVLKVTSAALPGLQMVARYCGDTLAPVLLGRGWHAFGAGWCPQAPLDDEAFPEVVITADPDDIPRGKGCKSLREAITWHHGAYRFRASSRPRGGEAEAMMPRSAAPARGAREQEASFEAAVISALGFGRHDGLTYHYLYHGTELAGWGIAGNTTGISHGYHLWTARVPRLVTYFLWQIYLHERRNGAAALNLGGSETRSLYDYKTRTFPDHALQRTSILRSPVQRPGRDR